MGEDLVSYLEQRGLKVDDTVPLWFDHDSEHEDYGKDCDIPVET